MFTISPTCFRPWTRELTPAQLERQERDAILEWRRSLAQWVCHVFSVIVQGMKLTIECIIISSVVSVIHAETSKLASF